MSDDRFTPENNPPAPPTKPLPRKLVPESRRYLDLIPPPLPPGRGVSAEELEAFIADFERKFRVPKEPKK